MYVYNIFINIKFKKKIEMSRSEPWIFVAISALHSPSFLRLDLASKL